jgi:FkbM family methyltransferase
MMHFAAGLLRNLLPNWMVEAGRKLVERVDPFLAISYSQDGEDMVLRRLFEHERSGFYVDVGAHHPFRFSNTCYFHRMGWRGINVDANPDAIAAFRHARPADINLCVGISGAAGELTYHLFNEPALNTFDPNLASERALLPGYRLLQKERVPVERLDELLRVHLPANQAIDLMSIDVEGLDLSVLQSNDWQRFRARYLLVEARDFDMGRPDESAEHRFASSVGYRLIAKTVNTLIYEDAQASQVRRVP